MSNKHIEIETVLVSDHVLEEVYDWFSHYKSIENAESGADREYGYESDYLEEYTFNEMLTYVLKYMR